MASRDLVRYPAGGLMPLSDAMNQLLHDAFTTPFAANAATMIAGMNLYETDDRYIVQVPLPGMQLDQLNITARQNVVTLQGTTEIPAPESARNLHMGAAQGQFFEQIQLPGDVDAERATATYEDGVLTLTLPKATSGRTQTIRVSDGHRGQQQAKNQHRLPNGNQAQGTSTASQEMRGQATAQSGQSQGRQGS